MPLITWTGPNVPDGSQHTGVCPCEKRPSAHCWDWTQITTRLLPCHGTLSGDLHACTKTGTGMKHMTCMKLLYKWGSGCELIKSVSALTSASMSPVLSAEMVGFVLMCGLKDNAGEVRIKGCREFKGIWKEKLTKNQQENKLASLCEKMELWKGYRCS